MCRSELVTQRLPKGLKQRSTYYLLMCHFDTMQTKKPSK